MDWTLIVALLVLGAATGFVAGLLGIGGGMLLVPFLTMLFTLRAFPEDHLVHMAIATSLATILFTSASSVLAHHRRGAVLWPVVKVLAPGILVGALIGAQIAGRLSTVFIALFFGVFVGFSALQMLRDKKPKPSRELPAPLGMFGVGNAIGYHRGRIPGIAAAGRTWLRLRAGAVGRGGRQRPHRTAGRQGRARARYRPAQARLRAAALRAGRVHALPGSPGRIAAGSGRRIPAVAGTGSGGIIAVQARLTRECR